MADLRGPVLDADIGDLLEGNPLAVFTDARGIPDALLLSLAREMHLSETVFCYPARGTGHVRIRIFTPRHELPFAGHPVLGTAFVLAAPLQLPEIVLETGVGPVPVRIERDGPRIVFGLPDTTWPLVLYVLALVYGFATLHRSRYGRLLAYVWYRGESINWLMVRLGWAVSVRYPPNLRYAGIFDDAEARAAAEERGLWRVEGFSCRPADHRAQRC